jgi:hypothetical protein
MAELDMSSPGPLHEQRSLCSRGRGRRDEYKLMSSERSRVGENGAQTDYLGPGTPI